MNSQIQKAGLISGIGIFIMVLTVPIAEFVIFPELIDYNNAEITFNNITENRKLFTIGIFLHVITLICDLVVAWSLYIFLKPTNKDFSLLVALFRIAFAIITLAALLNLVSVLNLTLNSDYLGAFNDSLYSKVLLAIKNFNIQWSFAFTFFSIYLMLLGVLVYKAVYVPKIFGVVLIIAGLGYFVETLRSFFFPSFEMDYLMITYFGELVFMFWLLIKSWRVKIVEE
nr:DUF4386 domain-containing protein [Allomuricauda sp.]